MIEKYKSEILQYYEQKRDAGLLSSNLTLPTPAKICKEVRLLLASGCDHTDMRTLKEFLDIPYDKEFLDVSYKKWKVDKFRPLCTFLKRKINTREKNIELLAWLIDFNPRPFSNYWRSSKGITDPLSELSITEKGIVEANKLNRYQHQALPQREAFDYTSKVTHQRKQLAEKDTEIAEFSNLLIKEKSKEKEVKIEYPSGVKLTVDASDLSLIAQLLRL
jgi:hypothetical protein